MTVKTKNYWIDTNLSFEYELASRPSKSLDRFTKPWQNLLCLLPGFENAAPIFSSPECGPNDEIVVWGVLERHRVLFPSRFPDSSSVFDANSKLWSFNNREEGLSHSAILSTDMTEEELRKEIKRTPKWIIKDPFGVAGRERFNGTSTSDIESIKQWMQKRLRAGKGKFLLETYVDIELEFSTHYEIQKDGAITYQGVCAILCDANGSFRGNFRLREEHASLAKEAKENHQPLLEKLRDLGYFGPLSFDSFLGEDHHRRCFQTVSEINARYTFGRMFLELQKALNHEDLLWWHPSPGVFKKCANATLNATPIPFPIPSLNQTNTLLLSTTDDAFKDMATILSPSKSGPT